MKNYYAVFTAAVLGCALAANVRADWDQGAFDQAMAAEKAAEAAIAAAPANTPADTLKVLEKALSGKQGLRVKAEARMLLTCATPEAAAATLARIKAVPDGAEGYVEVVDQWVNDADMSGNKRQQVAHFKALFGAELAANTAHPEICYQAWLLEVQEEGNFDRAITSPRVSGSRADRMTRNLADEAERLAKLKMRYEAAHSLALEAMAPQEYTRLSYVQRVIACFLDKSADAPTCREYLEPVRVGLEARSLDAGNSDADKAACAEALRQFLEFYAILDRTAVPNADFAHALAARDLAGILQEPVVNEAALWTCLEQIGVTRPAKGQGVAPLSGFITSSVRFNAAGSHNFEGLREANPVAVLDVTISYDFADMAAWLAATPRKQVIVGWNAVRKSLGDPRQRFDVTENVLAAVRLIRAVRPDMRVWVFVHYPLGYDATRRPEYLQAVSAVADGIALDATRAFQDVPIFASTREAFQADARRLPVLLAGFYGLFPLNTRLPVPADFAARMAAAEQAARDAGFAGFVQTEW